MCCLRGFHAAASVRSRELAAGVRESLAADQRYCPGTAPRRGRHLLFVQGRHRSHDGAGKRRLPAGQQRSPERTVLVVDWDLEAPGCIDSSRAAWGTRRPRLSSGLDQQSGSHRHLHVLPARTCRGEPALRTRRPPIAPLPRRSETDPRAIPRRVRHSAPANPTCRPQ